MKLSYFSSLLAAVALLSGCSKESPFIPEGSAEGQILKSAISVDIPFDEVIRNQALSRASLSADDFTVSFIQEGSSRPYAQYLYSEMPEVITLPEGKYTCNASYGQLLLADWDAPYFVGQSEVFEIKAYEINSYISPIECSLENVMVTVNFGPDLRNHMSDDSAVEVKVGASSSLHFTKAEADVEKAGYFACVGETTLVATFSGRIDGEEISMSKTLNTVKKGCHYKITFRLHNEPDGDGRGDVDGNIVIDASVDVVDVKKGVDPGDDPVLDDNERPGEGDNPNPPGPGDDDPKNDLPTITPKAPLVLDAPNDAFSLTDCILYVHSSSPDGIIGFDCDIDSPILTQEVLEGFSLDTHLNLVNPKNSDMASALSGFGFPVYVGGQKDVTFNITDFLGALEALSEDYPGVEHKFKITVTDAYGSTSRTLILKY